MGWVRQDEHNRTARIDRDSYYALTEIPTTVATDRMRFYVGIIDFFLSYSLQSACT